MKVKDVPNGMAFSLEDGSVWIRVGVNPKLAVCLVGSESDHLPGDRLYFEGAASSLRYYTRGGTYVPSRKTDGGLRKRFQKKLAAGELVHFPDVEVDKCGKIGAVSIGEQG